MHCVAGGRLEKAIRQRQQVGKENYQRETLRLRDLPNMLYTIAIVLLVLWLIGWLGFHLLGGFIHILVILAVIAIVIALVKKV